MRRSKFCRELARDEGSAALEFVTVGMILLVPLVYLVVAMSAIQAGALSVEGAARQAARVYVQSNSTEQAESRAERAVDFALADYGLKPGNASVTITCSPHPENCLARRGFVTVSVRATVRLPLAPTALDASLPLAVPISATATQQVSRFWGAG
jgi:Flp pilus assembly protein TadG